MKRLLAILLCLLPNIVLAQATVQQGGSFAAGRVPTYSGSSGSPIVNSAGGAGGTGVGIAELPVIARGTGLPPFVAQGSGPLGTIFTIYDGPTNSAAGYHYFGLHPNSQGGGLLTYGAGGGAAELPLNFIVNGITYPFPFGGGGGGGGIVGPGTTIANDVVCWNNLVGTLVKDCGQTIQFSGSTSGTTTLSSQAIASGALSLPAATDTLVGRATTDTLTNKTLTAPIINGGTITSPTIATAVINSPSITSPTISNATINTATITSAAMGNASTATTQSPGDSSALLATTKFVSDAVNVGMPIGVCIPYGGTSAPTNWAFAFGQAISRTGFATLFAAYGILYGSGDGTTTFNMPDLRGRIPAGKDDMGGSAANRLTVTSMTPNSITVGAVGGSQTNTASTTSAGVNFIQLGAGWPGITGGGWSGNTGAAAGADFQALTTGSLSATAITAPIQANNTITVSGTSGAFTIVQPTMIMNTICKIQ